MNHLSQKQKTTFADRLLRWFGEHQRELPFRGTRDPYVVWISESMLQQTQVTTVLPYFERFIDRFPTVRHLAEADLDEVLSLWAGLGYYRRARHLHAAAREIIDEHGGRFPDDKRSVLRLPGIGPYTAGAILSIAFGRPEPLVDGNVSRVLCRVFEIAGDPGKGSARRQLWELAGELVSRDQPGDFNQALMELGALVCTPGDPSCPGCPLGRLCLAHQNGSTELFPETRTAPAPETVEVAVAVIRHGRKALIARRPAGVVLAGMWEFPSVERKGKLPARSLLRRTVKRMFGITIDIGEHLTTVRHAIMDRRFLSDAYVCAALVTKTSPTFHDEAQWVPLAELDRFPMPSASGKIREALLASIAEPRSRRSGP